MECIFKFIFYKTMVKFKRYFTYILDIIDIASGLIKYCYESQICWIMLLTEMDKWNIDSVTLLHYYSAGCKMCCNSILNNEKNEENNEILFFQLIIKYLYFSYSIGRNEITESMLDLIVIGENKDYIDGAEYYRQLTSKVFLISQTCIIISIFVYFKLFKELPPYNMTFNPFFIPYISYDIKQDQFSPMIQCYNVLKSFFDEIRLYNLKNYQDIYGFYTILVSLINISKRCDCDYTDVKTYLKFSDNLLLYSLYLSECNDNNKIDENDYKILMDKGYLSIYTHYNILQLKNNKNINKDDIITNDSNKTIIHILLDWIHYSKNNLTVINALKILNEKAILMHQNGLKQIINFINNNTIEFNKVIESMYTIELCNIIFYMNNKYQNNNEKYINYVYKSLNKINEESNYCENFNITQKSSLLIFLYELHSVLFSSLQFVECIFDVNEWVIYTNSLQSKIYPIHSKSLIDGITNEEKYIQQTYYNLIYSNYKYYIDSYISTIFLMVKDYINSTSSILNKINDLPCYSLLLCDLLWKNNTTDIKILIDNINNINTYCYDSIVPNIVHYNILYNIYNRCSIYDLYNLIEILINNNIYQWKIWRYV